MYATTEDLASLSQLNTNAVQEIYLLTGTYCLLRGVLKKKYLLIWH